MKPAVAKKVGLARYLKYEEIKSVINTADFLGWVITGLWTTQTFQPNQPQSNKPHLCCVAAQSRSHSLTVMLHRSYTLQ